MGPPRRDSWIHEPETVVPKKSTRSSRQNDTPPPGTDLVPAGPLANLYRVAAIDQFSRLEEDPTIPEREKLHALYDVLNNLLDVIYRLSRSAPETAPELWLERANKFESVFDFIERVYGRFLQRGLKKSDLRRLDPSLYKALFNWSRSHKGNPDLVLPTKKEANDHLLAQLENMGAPKTITDILPSIFRDQLRLYRTASSRNRQRK